MPMNSDMMEPNELAVAAHRNAYPGCRSVQFRRRRGWMKTPTMCRFIRIIITATKSKICSPLPAPSGERRPRPIMRRLPAVVARTQPLWWTAGQLPETEVVSGLIMGATLDDRTNDNDDDLYRKNRKLEPVRKVLFFAVADFSRPAIF